MKKIIITGVNTFVGSALKQRLQQEPMYYSVEMMSLRDGSWEQRDFSGYDTVFHVAGIAHVSTDPNMEEKYFQINRDLTIRVAEKAKADGVSQFIFMSSIIVYGEASANKRVITASTAPTPANFYGESKLQAEIGIKQMDDVDYKVAIIRSPMIYGENSKGNYPRLAKIARITPIFPDFDNERSMIHIDNLAEFIKLIIDNNETGLFFPQNAEYTKTSEMVRQIAEVNGRRIILTRFLNPLVRLSLFLKIGRKVFGNLIYDRDLSHYSHGSYQVRTFQESIIKTEG